MKRLNWLILILHISVVSLFADEGMYPLPMIDGLRLQEKGLHLTNETVYNPGNTSLINAVVRVNGCTGSFVSDQGLIITNHHCAFRAANLASDAEHDYIRDGFLADSRAREIPARGYTVRITESYRDVSAEVLDGLDAITAPLERQKALEKRIKTLTARAEEAHPGKRAEIAEMFKGEQYVLFIYTFLKDIRLVYIPPRAIGEFGGDIDNYEWPRHTGDFSFLRAYVAPNGQPAEYAPENVPYRPAVHLRVNPEGVNENDFVFILGYPGRSYRNRGSAFLNFEEKAHLPQRLAWYQWMIATMEKISADDRGVALKHLSRIKSLANLEKRYRGRLQGMNRLDLTARRRGEETAIREKWPETAPLFKALDSLYAARAQRQPLAFWMERLRSDVHALYWAGRVIGAARERAKPDLERESAYMERNWKRTRQAALRRTENFYMPTDKAMLAEILRRLYQLPDVKNYSTLRELEQDIRRSGSMENFVDHLYAHSRIYQRDVLDKMLESDSSMVAASQDAFIRLRWQLEPVIRALREQNRLDGGALSRLQPLYNQARKKWLKHNFIPDANGTLRLTYGHIRGSHPADAVYLAPMTALQGILEKYTGQAPFNAPEALLTAIDKHNSGVFYNPAIQSVPVCILYDCDTIGGNSGSPVMDANGRLIGVNFDRAFEGTINDYAYSTRYSRSIAVDIRYVLWILRYVAGADTLLKEMGIH
ncbi:MAG: S46 family peptidase [Calditrichaeota bacterium]|nr:MAG: S46 family peptidase [Calditrichota bacterium]